MKFAMRVDKIKAYWLEAFGDGPAAHSCIAFSVSVLAALYVVALVWMVPASIVRAYR